MALSKDRTGEIYGDWIILSKEQTTKDPKGTYVAWWKVKCIHCGFEKTSRFKNLKTRKNIGKPRCKCTLSNFLSEKAKKQFRGGFGNIPGAYWHQLKRSAKKRSFEFLVTIEYANKLLEDQEFKCKLSGVPIKMSPENSYWLNGKRLDTASLDRIDSTKGYIEGNVQWVHQKVNFMKLDMPENEFIQYCRLIANNNK